MNPRPLLAVKLRDKSSLHFCLTFSMKSCSFSALEERFWIREEPRIVIPTVMIVLQYDSLKNKHLQILHSLNSTNQIVIHGRFKELQELNNLPTVPSKSINSF